ncbi:ribosomal protein L7/L12 [Sporosarcina ureae]|uniref:ribosomal protein L7/L12 n=1 Tax=Sporosarcina ureae TaxID=1571 RepID=UPI0028AA7BBB|nr:ribosomal protein L7/L12 [Sporosarcina ureae]
MTTQLSLLIITLCAVIIISVLLSKIKKSSQTKLSTINPELTLEVQNMIKSNTSNTKIIKHVREKTGLGLVEAKEYVDNIK